MSKIEAALEKATLASAKGLARTQTEIDKILWGRRSLVYSAGLNTNGNATFTANQRESSGQRTQSTVNTANTAAVNNANNQGNTGNRFPNPLDLGLIPLLDIISAADLCNIINYLYSQIGGPSPKPRSTTPTAAEKGLYFIQDQCLFIQRAIDTFYSFPNQLIGRFTNGSYEEVAREQIERSNGENVSSQQAFEQGQVPGATTSGVEARKFNLFNLITYIGTSLNGFLETKDVDGSPILTPEDTELINEVPFLQQNLTIFTDYIGILNRYADYRNIPNEDVQRILQTIDKIRAACVVIQSLDFKSPASFLALLPPSTVRAQLAQLQKFIDPTKAIPTLTKISNTINSFNRYVRNAQQTLTRAQLIVRIGIVLLKVFRIIIRILKRLPIPNKYTTTGQTNSSASRVTAAELLIKDIERVLGQVKGLLNVFISFVRYIRINIDEILIRLNNIINNLRLCKNLQDTPVDLGVTPLQTTQLNQQLPPSQTSPIIQVLETSRNNVVQLQTEIDDYLTNYTARLDRQRTFGDYTIRVVEEEVVDEGIVNRRRRGIALDRRGVVAVSSDLTFATDENIIVQEVRIRLISEGLVSQSLAEPFVATIVDDVAAFLEDDELIRAETPANIADSETINQDVRRLTSSQVEDRALRRQSRAAARDVQRRVRNEINRLKSENIVRTPNQPAQATNNTTTPVRQENYEVRVFIGDQVSRIVTVRAANADQAIALTKQRVDPDNKHPTWKYSVKKLK